MSNSISRSKIDGTLSGVAVLGSSLLLGSAMYAPSLNTGMVGPIVRQTLFAGFGELAWIVPLTLGAAGIALLCDAAIKLIFVMGLASVCYLLIAATLLNMGSVGHTFCSAFAFAFGDLSNTVSFGLLSVLAFSMSGGSRATIMKAIVALWDMRLPPLPQRIETGAKYVEEANVRAVPIALPVRITPRPEEAYSAYTIQHPVVISAYVLPGLSLLKATVFRRPESENKEQAIVDALASFGVGVSVVNREIGPTITRYEISPNKGVKVAKISNLANDIALALAARSVRIESPVPGKSVVGIEVPNTSPVSVGLRDVLETAPKGSGLVIGLGKDITGKPVFADLCTMPHLLVAGATGAGKSVCLNSLIASLLISHTPDKLQLLLIDPKRVELSVYNGIPHLVKDVITDPRMAAGALFEMTKEMDARYKRLEKAGARNIEEYNRMYPERALPFIVVVIDELADLMMIARDKVEDIICRLAQLARATGIHLIVATQRPSVDVITGIIKANIPSRIAFAVSSQVDSRTILDIGGAEKLLGKGDMLFLPMDAQKPIRVQGALITGDEVARLVTFWRGQSRPVNSVNIQPEPIEIEQKSLDSLTCEAAYYAVSIGSASVAKMQARFNVGHPRALRLMSSLEELGVISRAEGTKPRSVLVKAEDLETMGIVAVPA